MKMGWSAIAATMCLLCTGCAGLRYAVNGGVPLDKVVLDNFHALTLATDRQFFEEFVKFRVLGSTFDLYDIGETSIEVATSEGVTDTNQGSVSFPFVVSKGAGVTKTIAINNGDTGKLTIKLNSIANDPEGYKCVAYEFAKASPTIYATITKDAEHFADVCTDETYCFRIPNDHDTYAYLADVGAFRKLVDTISRLAPPKAPSTQSPTQALSTQQPTPAAPSCQQPPTVPSNQESKRSWSGSQSQGR